MKTKAQKDYIRDYKTDIFTSWLFNTVVFALIPIIIITVVNVAFGRKGVDVLLLPDWSFGAVVIFGSVITQFVELKTKFQKDAFMRIDNGLKVFIVLIIISTAFLPVVVLSDMVIVPAWFIGFIQLALFFLAGVATYTTTLVREEFMNSYDAKLEIDVKVTRTYVPYALEESERLVESVAKAVVRPGVLAKEENFPVDTEYAQLLITKMETQLAAIKNAMSQQNLPSAL